MKAMIIGGTGFVGRHLAKRLDRPVVVGRNADKIKQRLGDVEARPWNPDAIDPSLFHGVDTVFHLAGESIFNGRWTPERKERIRTSRVDLTRRLVAAMGKCETRPKTLICASAIGYYGSRGNAVLNEDSTPGLDFLAQVCVDWEKAAMRASEYGLRVASLRNGLVLGKGGGALAQMLPIFRKGLGGRLGEGRQFMSWIHIDDLTSIMLHVAKDESLSGPINAVAPKSVTNAKFTRTLGRVLKRPAFFHVPGFVLRLALGEFATAPLSSQRVIPEKLHRAGFEFAYPELKEALENLLD